MFKQNFVYPFTNERYKTHQTRFSFDLLGHAPGVGLGGTLGVGWVQKNSEIQPELVCELITCMAHAIVQLFGSPHHLGPWGGAKGQVSLNLNY